MTTSELDFILKKQFMDLRQIIGYHYKKRTIIQAHRKCVKQWIDALRELQDKTGFV
jgi:hypothetical protein